MLACSPPWQPLCELDGCSYIANPRPDRLTGPKPQLFRSKGLTGAPRMHACVRASKACSMRGSRHNTAVGSAPRRLRAAPATSSRSRRAWGGDRALSARRGVMAGAWRGVGAASVGPRRFTELGPRGPPAPCRWPRPCRRPGRAPALTRSCLPWRRRAPPAAPARAAHAAVRHRVTADMVRLSCLLSLCAAAHRRRRLPARTYSFASQLDWPSCSAVLRWG